MSLALLVNSSEVKPTRSLDSSLDISRWASVHRLTLSQSCPEERGFVVAHVYRTFIVH
jgi:hypothetical protein